MISLLFFFRLVPLFCVVWRILFFERIGVGFFSFFFRDKPLFLLFLGLLLSPSRTQTPPFLDLKVPLFSGTDFFPLFSSGKHFLPRVAPGRWVDVTLSESLPRSYDLLFPPRYCKASFSPGERVVRAVSPVLLKASSFPPLSSQEFFKGEKALSPRRRIFSSLVLGYHQWRPSPPLYFTLDNFFLPSASEGTR